MITKNPTACKEASSNSQEASTFLKQEAGNVIPHAWYGKIITNGGKADTIAICLLDELWSLYRSTGQEEHQKDYCFFSKKFNLSTYQIREAFVRLEALNLMYRRIGTQVVQGRTFGNILYVIVNVKEISALATNLNNSNNRTDDHNDHTEAKIFDQSLSDSNNTDSANSNATKVKSQSLQATASNTKFTVTFFCSLVQSYIKKLKHLYVYRLFNGVADKNASFMILGRVNPNSQKILDLRQDYQLLKVGVICK